jgi:hypothetical protein
MYYDTVHIYFFIFKVRLHIKCISIDGMEVGRKLSKAKPIFVVECRLKYNEIERTSDAYIPIHNCS